MVKELYIENIFSKIPDDYNTESGFEKELIYELKNTIDTISFDSEKVNFEVLTERKFYLPYDLVFGITNKQEFLTGFYLGIRVGYIHDIENYSGYEYFINLLNYND